jgi:sigma54-dependent transcription regulator
VSLCQHEDLIVDRFEILHQNRYEDRATPIAGDIRSVSPETEVRRQRVEFRYPWAFEDVYGALHDFAADYPFEPCARAPVHEQSIVLNSDEARGYGESRRSSNEGVIKCVNF